MTETIYTLIPKIMAECGAIAKDRSGQGISYKFRGIDDIYNHLQPIKAKYGVFEVPEVLEEYTELRKSSRGNELIYRRLKIKYTFYAPDGSNVSAITMGEAMDSGDKASNKAMAAAHKYANIQIFNIMTYENSDTEYSNASLGSTPATRPPINAPQQQPPQGPSDNGVAAIMQVFHKAKSAFQAVGVSSDEMLMYVNKKRPQDLTKGDLNKLSQWLNERKGAKT